MVQYVLSDVLLTVHTSYSGGPEVLYCYSHTTFNYNPNLELLNCVMDLYYFQDISSFNYYMHEYVDM